MMLIHHFILGLPADARDEKIRTRYLELVKQYTPEKAPEQFRRITDAYEAIKNKRLRISQYILGDSAVQDYERALHRLAGAREITRKRVGLQELLMAEERGGRD